MPKSSPTRNSIFRQTVTLTKPQQEYLKTRADELGISISDLIRRIVDQYREGRA